MRFYLSVVTLFVLSSCGLNDPEDSFVYKITPDGAAQISDRQKYEALGEQSFSKVQKYRIIVQGEGKKPFHYLSANITKKIGNKIIETQSGVTIPIIDGLYIYECNHMYFDINISKSADDTDNPTCDFELLGSIVPTVKATKID